MICLVTTNNKTIPVSEIIHILTSTGYKWFIKVNGEAYREIYRSFFEPPAISFLLIRNKKYKIQLTTLDNLSEDELRLIDQEVKDGLSTEPFSQIFKIVLVTD